MALAFRSILNLPRVLGVVSRSLHYRTNVTDPCQHSAHDIGLFYRIEDADYDSYMHSFFNREHKRLMDTLEDPSIMVRAPSLEVISCLTETDFSKPVNRYILYGDRGSGISCQLAHIVHWCVRKGWLIVHWHDLYRILRYTPQIEPSSFKPGFYDSPNESANWLKRFSTVNAAWLQHHQPSLTREVVWNLKESCGPGTSWQELIQFGISRPKYSTDALSVLLREIREQATTSVGSANGEWRVLVCLDGVNCLWSTGSRLLSEKKSKLRARDLSIFQAFRRMVQPNWSCGAIVTSVSQKAAWMDSRAAKTPHYLLGNEGFTAMEPFLPIFVDVFGPQEARNFVDYHVEKEWISNPKCKEDDEAINQIIFLSDFNPKELSVICGEW